MAYEQNTDYVDVAERIRLFRAKYPEGSLQPRNPSEPFQVLDIAGATFIVYIAAAYRTPQDSLPGIAVAWEPFPGRTPFTAGSELMNAETAAWGRAIVAALAADTKKVASLNEVQARTSSPTTSPQNAPPARQITPSPEHPSNINTAVTMATEAQEKALFALSKKLDRLPPARGTLTKVEAMRRISELKDHEQEMLQAAQEPEPDYDEPEPDFYEPDEDVF